MNDAHHIKDKMYGCLYGQAIGDALGFASEAMTKEDVKINYPHGISKYSDIIRDDRRKGWPIGFWTDDTEMMLAVLDCLIDSHEETINTKKLASHFLSFYDKWGFTCGKLTRKVLNFAPPIYAEKPLDLSKMVWELKGKNNAPNGGLMRTSVVGLWPYNVIENATNVCRMTHYDPRCVCSCVIVCSLIYNMIWKNNYLTIQEIVELADKFEPECKEWILSAWSNENIESLKLDDENTMAYTYRTLSAALWVYFHAKDFETGLLAVVNEGGDADTNAAVACAILGAKFGYSSIPKYYIVNLNNRAMFHQKITSFINQITDEKA